MQGGSHARMDVEFDARHGRRRSRHLSKPSRPAAVIDDEPSALSGLNAGERRIEPGAKSLHRANNPGKPEADPDLRGP